MTMIRQLKYNKDERLCDWCDRIAAYYENRAIDAKTLREVLGEVSKWSYIHGSNDALKTVLNH